jgi:hypothetical protein
MTPDKQAIRKLREAVEAGTCPMDMAIAAIPKWSSLIMAAFDGSFDAAFELHKAMLPRWSAEARISGFGGGQAAVWDPMKSPGRDIRVQNDNPARAWLICILKALEAQA